MEPLAICGGEVHVRHSKEYCMSELKFSCPLCGQRMECEKAYIGDTVVCPGCRADVRVPSTHSPLDPKTSLPRAELIRAAGELPDNISSPDDENPFAQSSALKTAVAPIESKRSGEGKAGKSPGEIRFQCPMCQAALVWPRDVLAGSIEQAGSLETTDDGAGSGARTHAEREKQIAAARDSHPVSLYPSLKPRMSYILSGGEVPKSSNTAEAGGAKAEESSSSSKSLTE